MSDYIKSYFKKRNAQNKIDKKEKKSKNIKQLNKQIKKAEIKIDILKKGIEIEKFNIKKDILRKYNMTEEDLNEAFFEDFGLFMGKEIKVFPKKNKISKKLIKNQVKLKSQTSCIICQYKKLIEDIKLIDKKLHKKLISKKPRFVVGELNNKNYSNENKKTIEYILGNTIYFLLFYNENAKNSYTLKKVMEGHFGNPDFYLYYNDEEKSLNSIDILEILDYRII